METTLAMSAEHSLIDCLYHIAHETPQHEAIVTAGYSLTYFQLARLTGMQAEKLRGLGITEHSIVGIKCSDETHHLIFCLSVSCLGATSYTIPSYEPQQTQEAMISRLGMTHILDESTAVDLKLSNREQPSITSSARSKDSRFLFSSSGTTGEPKLVIHHASDLVVQAQRHISGSSERFACLASIEHNFAKRHRLYCLAQGATNVFINAGGDELISLCKLLNVGVIHVSVFQAQQLLAIPNISELSDIRLKLGGSHAVHSLRQQIRQAITQNLQAGYGTTETGAICFTDPKDIEAEESVGRPLPGIEIRVVTKNRKLLETGQKGEIAVRCKGMFRGYMGKADLTASSLEDDWFYTGDIGYLDEQQRLYLCGRADDMFVFNSINIYPQDIEVLLCQYPAVLDSAVIPKKSAVHGDIPIAFVAFDSGKKDQDELEKLKSFARSQLGLRCPQQFIVLDKIPRNASGKISRLEVQTISLQSDELRVNIIKNLQHSQVLNGFKADVVQGFERGENDIFLSGIKMDSLTQMDLLVMLETTYDKVVTPQQFVEMESLNDVVAMVLSTQAQQVAEEGSSLGTVFEKPALSEIERPPYIVHFFRRVFRCCKTVAELNKALASFEYRLTPLDIECLEEWHQSQRLIPSDAEQKFHTALRGWLMSIKSMMLESGKQQPEPFVSKRIRPMLSHFIGSGAAPDKTLIICFSIARSRQMAIPNTVLMQHTDASRFDLLMVGTFNTEGFDLGVPSLGNNALEIIDFLMKLDFVHEYKKIRTIGCSAGAPIAVLAANRLDAEMAVSLGARFHRYYYPLKILKRFYTVCKGMQKLKNTKVIYSYSAGRMRDYHFAKLMSFLFGGDVLTLKIEKRKLSHIILDDLLALHRLKYFFEHTIFSEPIDSVASENLVLNVPSEKLELMK